MSLRRENRLILALLLILAAASWALLIWQANLLNGMGSGMDSGLTMGMGAGLFLAIWIVMMVAMMFPATAPVVLTFARVQREQGSKGGMFGATVVFVGAYLAIWTLFGVLAYLGALVATGLAQQVPWIMQNAARIGGGIIILAGLYQLTPLKRVCLEQCRTPLSTILAPWHDGYPGALRMGLQHGLACLGSSWLLFVLLFPLGIMNLAVMLLLTALVFVEKVVPQRWHMELLAAPVLVIYGILVMVVPAALPLSGTGM